MAILIGLPKFEAHFRADYLVGFVRGRFVTLQEIDARCRVSTFNIFPIFETMDFKNKIVWITGASSGIGEALAYEYASKGANLVLSARRESELQRVAQVCESHGGSVLVLPFDMVDLSTHAQQVEAVIQAFGRIDVLVLNAGVSQRSFVLDTQFDVYRRLFEINFFSIEQCIKMHLRRSKLIKSVEHINEF